MISKEDSFIDFASSTDAQYNFPKATISLTYHTIFEKFEEVKTSGSLQEIWTSIDEPLLDPKIQNFCRDAVSMHQGIVNAACELLVEEVGKVLGDMKSEETNSETITSEEKIKFLIKLSCRLLRVNFESSSKKIRPEEGIIDEAASMVSEETSLSSSTAFELKNKLEEKETMEDSKEETKDFSNSFMNETNALSDESSGLNLTESTMAKPLEDNLKDVKVCEVMLDQDSQNFPSYRLKRSPQTGRRDNRERQRTAKSLIRSKVPIKNKLLSKMTAEELEKIKTHLHKIKKEKFDKNCKFKPIFLYRETRDGGLDEFATFKRIVQSFQDIRMIYFIKSIAAEPIARAPACMKLKIHLSCTDLEANTIWNQGFVPELIKLSKSYFDIFLDIRNLTNVKRLLYLYQKAMSGEVLKMERENLETLNEFLNRKKTLAPICKNDPTKIAPKSITIENLLVKAVQRVKVDY